MFVLYETPAGYAIFKILDEQKLKEVENLYLEFESPEKASKIIKLKHFEKFSDTTEALSAATASVEGKISKPLKKTLKKLISDEVQAQLLVADSKLGNAIKDKFSVQCVYNTQVQELMRCIRTQSESLLSGLPKKEMTAMALGLAHSLSRYKLKFSPDKIDTMIIQAFSLLDDLDKELNNYIMRAREWYGWHFPELGKLITDNIAYIKVIKLVGTREKMIDSDLSDVLPEDVEEKVKEAAEISMGTEISEEDISNIQLLCEEILSINDYRTHLYDYLKTRMMAMAPNLTILVGDMIGARLITHAGSLVNLAKHPASTVQILGAEKALFRALKNKQDTPKYGIIYHAQLIGQCSQKNKGKMSRSLAAKASLATRVDAFGEDVKCELGIEHRAKLENRLRLLEEGNLRRLSGTGKAKAKLEKYHVKSETYTYTPEADSTISLEKKRKISEICGKDDSQIKIEPEASTSFQEKKKKKRKISEVGNVDDSQVKIEPEETASAQEIKQEKKKKKKKKLSESGNVDDSQVKIEPTQDEEDVQTSEKKKKKKKKHLDTGEPIVKKVKKEDSDDDDE